SKQTLICSKRDITALEAHGPHRNAKEEGGKKKREEEKLRSPELQLIISSYLPWMLALSANYTVYLATLTAMAKKISASLFANPQLGKHHFTYYSKLIYYAVGEGKGAGNGASLLTSSEAILWGAKLPFMRPSKRQCHSESTLEAGQHSRLSL
ncbi:hypothetical protein KUCAC02_025584, partial [Chaenocephalus aceratus]